MANADNREDEPGTTGSSGKAPAGPRLAVANGRSVEKPAGDSDCVAAASEGDALLLDMRKRVEALGASAEAMKTELPLAYGEGFGRIAEGLSLLVTKLSQPGKEPPPLVEAQGTDPAPQKHTAFPATVPAAIEPHLGEPWDQGAADALADLYASGAAGLSQHIAEQDQQRTRLSILIPAVAVAADSERSWLDKRFDELGQRIDRSVATTQLAASRSLAERLERLEGHLAGARDAPPLTAAEPIELPVNQVDRLATIELQLNELKGKLSDDQIVRLLTAVMPTDQELAQLAEIAAEKVAKRLGARAPGLPETSVDAPLRSVAPTPQIVEIEELLRKFVAERGRNDQEIGEALSCFQDALEHILDRMDALEGTQAPNDAQQTSAASPWLDDDQAEQAAAAEAPPTRASSPESRAANVAASEIRLSRETTLQDTSPSAEAAKPSLTTMATVLSARAQPRYLMTASLAAFLLAGYWLASGPKLLPAIEAIGQRTEPGLMDREASASPAQTNARAVEEPAPRLRAGEPSAPAADEKGGNFAPEPIIRAQQPSSETQTAVEGSRQGGDNAQTARPELPSTGPSISGPVGITVQQGSASLSPEDIMRLRQRQRMASLSSRLGQEAATTSNGASFPAPTAVGTAEPVSSMSGEAEAKKMLELPPAMIGPMSLRLAAARGDASAQFSVAMRFAEGKGVKQDFEQAAFWYQRAAAQGLAAAQYRLATLYERGLGVGADTGRARTWYKRAADQGNVKAMHNLAVLLAGRDGQPDYASAAKWFAEAADRGLTDSQYNLGVLHESGLGTSKDLAAAYKWFALAARGGDKEALRRRELVRSKLDAATVKVADVQISAWHPLPTEGEMNDPQAAGDVWRNRAATN